MIMVMMHGGVHAGDDNGHDGDDMVMLTVVVMVMKFSRIFRTTSTISKHKLINSLRKNIMTP